MKLKKIIISSIFILALMLSMISNVTAATFTGGSIVNNVMTRVPTSISYEDITRLETVASDATGKPAYVVNATKFNGSDTTWIVRMAFGNSTYEAAADYVLTLVPYSFDTVAGKVTSLPFKDIQEGTELYGKNWYYFGLFDKVTHNICGYAIAERIKRWPRWDDLTFNGITHRNVGYTGSYTEPCSSMFLVEHIEKKEEVG